MLSFGLECDRVKLISHVRLFNLALIFRVNLLNLIHVGVVLELLVSALSLNFSLFQDNYIIGQMDEFNSVRDQDSSAVLHETAEDLVKDLFAHVGIQGRDGVIHDKDIRTLVDGASKSDSSFLASGQVDTFLADFCEVTGGHD